MPDKADKKEAKGEGKQKGDSKADCELNPWPDYISHRVQLWEKYMKRHKEELAAKTPQPIKITLPDGTVKEGESWRTTPLQIAQGISHGLVETAVISKVNGDVWDLDRPLERDCQLEILKFENEEAQQVFWHSSAHILGEAMERFYGGCLCYGPPIENGFYYDMHHPERTVTQEDFQHLDNIVKLAVKDKQPFERLELTKAELLEMFAYNQFKVRILNEKVDTPTTTVYRCGPLIDLCRGPHVRNTGKIKAMQITKNSSSYWEGKADAESLQRIYGISFPDSKMLKEWQKFQEEAAARDHRKLGRDQELYFFHELSPGSCFFEPKGAHIYEKLQNFLKAEYRKRGYSIVVSPNLYNIRLWETSGHWQHYAKNMFSFGVEEDTFALKPMNCPGHCLMFDHRTRSWRELPLRLADFGVLHRNEASGALSGLTRVRRFQQDDAHIFCRSEQIHQEIKNVLEFMKAVYDIFGFTFKLLLSTRPDDYLGEMSAWDRAEEQLKGALDEFGAPWKINPGDGAFYGPKIDITVTDALRRHHQCATIQLDFQLPERFNLSYMDEKGERQRPVIIHRAILGSVERFMAVLTENFGGKWPFWLSPRQAIVVPIHSAMNDYATQVKKQLYEAGFECEADLDDGNTLQKKVRNAQLAQFNFILVVGNKEQENGTVNVRNRLNTVLGEFKVEDVVSRFQKLNDNFVKNSEEGF